MGGVGGEDTEGCGRGTAVRGNCILKGLVIGNFVGFHPVGGAETFWKIGFSKFFYIYSMITEKLGRLSCLCLMMSIT